MPDGFRPNFSNEIIEEVRDINHGRGIGNTEVPEEVRETIALERLVGVPSKVLEAEFGLSKSSVSAYANGATSTKSYNEPDEKLHRSIENSKIKITGLAIDKLQRALGSINLTDDVKPNIASMIAKDMSAIVKNMSPDVMINNDNRVVVYRPRMREEDQYQIIDVVD